MMKIFTTVAALLAGGVSLAIAQGLGTGSYPPVAGGAGGNPATNPGYIEYKMPSSGKTVKLQTIKHRGKTHVLVPMEMSCDVFRVNC
jgi:hypothetical protein